MVDSVQRTIVVVEDELLIRMLAVETLEDAGWSVAEFETADEAAAFAAANEGDIKAVFTDINMPGKLDGLDLATMITRTKPQVAVVVTSGLHHKLPDSLVGNVRFLPKPWRSDQLLAVLAKADNSRRGPTP